MWIFLYNARFCQWASWQESLHNFKCQLALGQNQGSETSGRNIILPERMEETGKRYFFQFLLEESGKNGRKWEKYTQSNVHASKVLKKKSKIQCEFFFFETLYLHAHLTKCVSPTFFQNVNFQTCSCACWLFFPLTRDHVHVVTQNSKPIITSL